VLPAWAMLLEYGCVAIAAAMIIFRRFARPASVQRSASKFV
jgi:hypothetical protein